MEKLENSKKTSIKRFLIIIISIIIIPPVLYGCFVTGFFFVLPKLDGDSQKTTAHYGFSHPLNAVTEDESEYIIVYYTNSQIQDEKYWTVIDDQEAIRNYKDTFVVYLNKSSVDAGVNRYFDIYCDGESVLSNNLSYFPYCMIYDDFFEPFKKKMALEEIQQYAEAHGIEEEFYYY